MVQELLICPFDNNFTDYSGRHTLYNGNPGYSCGAVTFAEGRLGTASAYFNGSSFLINTTDTSHIYNPPNYPYCKGLTLAQLPNSDDFLLGSTKNTMEWAWNGFVTTNSDLNFTIDCWVRLEIGGPRWYPICSSAGLNYGSYKVGWVLQIDTSTGHLQMIGFFGGDWIGNVLTSQFQVPFNEWTHIAVSVWRVTGYPYPTAQAMYKNGVPDTSIVGMNQIVRFSNGVFCASVGQDNWEYNPFFIGLGPTGIFYGDNDWSHGINPYFGHHFKGRIDNLRICLGQRWPVTEFPYLNPFTPPGVETTTTSTTATTTTGTTVSTTTYRHSSFIRDLLVVPFDTSEIRDSTSRHNLHNSGSLFYSSENNSRRFISDFQMSILVDSNRADWYLGSTPTDIYFHWYHAGNARRSLTDNNFCIDCWIKPESGGDRYYPIFSIVNTPEVGRMNTFSGCALQLDTLTGHLQLCQYAFGSHINPLDGINNSVESTFVVPMNQWSHIAIQSWKITPVQIWSYEDNFWWVPWTIDPPVLVSQIVSVLSRKNMYLNGVPDIQNGLTPYSIFTGTNAYVSYGPLVYDMVIGGGYVFDFPKVNADKIYYYFNGYIKNLRISEGPRFPTDGSVFNSQITTTSTTASTTGTTTTVGWTTYSTTTYSSTASTSTTYYPVGFFRDLITLPFDRSSTDSNTRHHSIDLPTSFSEDRKRGVTSAYFDGATKLEYITNESDWSLGSTDSGLYCQSSNNTSWYSFASIPNNNFTISVWIKLVSGGGRYYPICSSINSVGTGWVCQIDTQSRKLQMIGFISGKHILDFTSLPNSKDQNGIPINSVINMTMESSFSLDYNVWTHIAIVSYRTSNQVSAKLMYKDGVPDRSPGWVPSHVAWSNRGQVFINNPTIGLGSLYIGFCQKLDLPSSRSQGDYFKGYIDYLRISEGYRFPIDGTVFDPPLDAITTVTTTTETTTTTATTSTATTLSTMTTSTTYGTTSQTTNMTTATSQTTSTSTQTSTTLTSTTAPSFARIDSLGTPIASSYISG